MAKWKKEYRALLDELPRQGWAVSMTTQGHWKAIPPDKSMSLVHFSETDDPHGKMNIFRDLRLRGFVWPPPSSAKSEEEVTNEWADHAPDTPVPPAAADTPPSIGKAATPSITQSDKAIDKAVVKTVDQLFHALKEARSYDALAGDNLKRCKQKLEEAANELKGADMEKKLAEEDLAKAKMAFDKAFAAS